MKVNFLPLEKHPDQQIYEYKIDFDDQTDAIRDRIRALEAHPEILKSPKMFNGTSLIIPKELNNLEPDLEDGRKTKYTLLKNLKISDPACIRIFNMILNKSFKSMNLIPAVMSGTQRAGQRSYFNANAKNTLAKHKLEIWPGYITSVSQYEKGIFLSFDSCSKIIREETVSDILTSLCKKNPSDVQNAAFKALVGSTVFTKYSNKSYKIHDIDFTKNPESTFESRDGTQSFLNYYKNQYGIDIRDKKQPMLIHKIKRPEIPEAEISICLVPELCFMTGLTESQRADFKVMKDVADFTRLKPVIR